MSDLEWLEEKLGLHEEFRVYYVVDGYHVELLGMDGQISIAQAEAPTIAEAISKLREKFA